MQYPALAPESSFPTAALAASRGAFGDPRTRLRDRFAQAGADATTDQDLLELLLFRLLPRRDVSRAAERLLSSHGSLGRALAAPLDVLSDEIGPTAALELKVSEAIARRILRARFEQRPIVSSWDALIDYCKATLSCARTERLHVLFLDTKNVLIADEEHGRGTIDHTPIYPREIIRRALELNAKAIIVVHNHPSGDPTPSLADLDQTRQLADACEVLDLIFHDHVIVGRDTAVSLRAEGHL